MNSDYQLPAAHETETEMTFEMPNVLIGIENNIASIRFGGSVQVTLKTRVEFADKAVEEPMFRIRSTNRLSFGRDTITIINDAIETGSRLLPATSPGAKEYLESPTVLWHLLCERAAEESRKAGTDIFRIARSTFTLP